MSTEYRVIAQHDPHPRERRGWIVALVDHEGKRLQVLTRNRSRKEAEGMVDACALALECGARLLGNLTYDLSRKLSCKGGA